MGEGPLAIRPTLSLTLSLSCLLALSFSLSLALASLHFTALMGSKERAKPPAPKGASLLKGLLGEREKEL